MMNFHHFPAREIKVKSSVSAHPLCSNLHINLFSPEPILESDAIICGTEKKQIAQIKSICMRYFRVMMPKRPRTTIISRAVNNTQQFSILKAYFIYSLNIFTLRVGKINK